MVGYCDASWAPDPNDPRSVTGNIFTLHGLAISWNSKRQRTTAISSTEAEYMALSTATQEAVWLRRFCIELGIIQEKPLTIYCDNKGAIDLAKNKHYSPRTRHISTRHHFIRELIQAKKIIVDHLRSNEMPADILTKATAAPRLQKFMDMIGLFE